MLFDVLLGLHSLFRWAVVACTLAVGVRCARGWLSGRGWTPSDASFGRLWIGAIDLQVALGLLLYFTASPIAAAARRDLSQAWGDELLWFFGLVHPLGMLAAASVAHAGWIWARRTEDGGSERFRRLGLGLLGALVLMTLAIPWPFLPHGRPLARV